ncbi:MAG: polymer-forming cytoskeletal protein [Planctomycetota bacterium]
MARHTGPRQVQCYHCRHRFEVGGRAQSTSCPGCNKPVIVADIEVKAGKVRGPLLDDFTCGKVIVHKRGRLIVTRKLVANDGVTVHGTLDAKTIHTGGPVHLGKTADYKGDLQGPSLKIEKGAKVKPSMIEVPSDPLGMQANPSGSEAKGNTS